MISIFCGTAVDLKKYPDRLFGRCNSAVQKNDDITSPSDGTIAFGTETQDQQVIASSDDTTYDNCTDVLNGIPDY